MKQVWPYVLLSVFCGMLFFWRLGAVPLIGLDEGLYAESSREMLASGDYIVPTCNGSPFFEKPPLTYWLQAASMRRFGVSSFAARLPSAVEELLLVALTVFLGTRLFGRRAGLVSGFALASSLLTVGLARMAVTDAAFALCITASLGSFVLGYTGLARRTVYLGFWAAMGASAMVKGPAGPALILLTVIVFLLVRRDMKAVLKTLPLPGLAIAIAIALPWYVLVQNQTGGDFLREFLFHQNLERALGKDFEHNAPFWFYVPAYLVGFFPWSVFLPAALLSSQKHEREKTRKGEGYATTVLLASWIAVTFVVFSGFASKLPAYIFPIYPASALLVGELWARRNDGSGLKIGAFAAAVFAAVIGAAMLIVPPYLRDPIPGLQQALLPMVFALVVGCIAAWLLLLLRRPVASFAFLCAGMGAFLLLAIRLGLPIAARPNAVPAAKLARMISIRTEPAVAYWLSPPQPALGFYAARPVPDLETPSQLRSALRRRPDALIIAQEGRRQGLPPNLKILARVKPYVLLQDKPITR